MSAASYASLGDPWTDTLCARVSSSDSVPNCGLILWHAFEVRVRVSMYVCVLAGAFVLLLAIASQELHKRAYSSRTTCEGETTLTFA